MKTGKEIPSAETPNSSSAEHVLGLLAKMQANPRSCALYENAMADDGPLTSLKFDQLKFFFKTFDQIHTEHDNISLHWIEKMKRDPNRCYVYESLLLQNNIIELLGIDGTTTFLQTLDTIHTTHNIASPHIAKQSIEWMQVWLGKMNEQPNRCDLFETAISDDVLKQVSTNHVGGYIRVLRATHTCHSQIHKLHNFMRAR
jgi:hypothetical protein